MSAEQLSNDLTPHGGTLVNRVVTDKAQASELMEKCASVLRIRGQIAREIVNIAYGFFSPLQGFMNRADLESVCKNMTLSNGLVWSLPIVCDVPEQTVELLEAKPGDSLLLEYHNVPFAVMELEEIYTFDPNYMAACIYEKENVDHPGLKQMHSLNNHFLAGNIWLINEPRFQKPYKDYFYTPTELRDKFKRRHWKRVLAYHSATVPHMGHEWLMKSCWFQHKADAILVSCAVGSKRIGDCIDECVLLAHDQLLESGYFKENCYMTSLFLWDTRHAGPREAVLHAIVRKNMGCTGHIINKNYAAPEEFGDSWDAYFFFRQLPEMGIESVVTKEWFYCEQCGGITYSSFCNHVRGHEMFKSKSVCSLLSSGVKPSNHLLRPEVFDTVIGAADEYGFGDGYVTDDYLQRRNPIFTLEKF
jgi:sulfate adenylyltransferase